MDYYAEFSAEKDKQFDLPVLEFTLETFLLEYQKRSDGTKEVLLLSEALKGHFYEYIPKE